MSSTLRVVGTGIAWNTIASIAVKLLAIANVFLILKHLSVYDYGIVQLVLTVVSTVGGLLLPGLSSVLVSDLARMRGEGKVGQASALARQFFILQLILGAIAFLVLFFGSSLFATHLHQPTIALYLRIASFSFVAGTLRALLTVLTAAELRFKFQSVLSIFDEAIKLLFLFGFFALQLGAGAVLYATVLAPLAVVVLTLPWGIRSLMPLMRAPAAEEPWHKLILSHRFWGIASSYLTTLNQNARLWVVQLFLGTEAVGLFSFAQGLVSQAVSLVTFPQIAAPIIARAAHAPERLADYANRALKYQLWIALLALVPGALITPFFIHRFFPVYEGATLMTLIGLFMIIPAAVNVPIGGVYAALKQQKELFVRATLVKSVVLSIILVPLILTLGTTGVMVEFVVTNLVSVIERTRSLRHSVPGFLRSWRPFLVFDATDLELFRRMQGPAVAFINRVILRHDA